MSVNSQTATSDKPSSPSSPKPKKQYFDSINYLRGFAILMIVWCHFRGIIMGHGGAKFDGFAWWIFNDFYCSILDGATSMFVFISGFLFHKIFYARGFEYRRFMISKVKKVFLPYFLIATCFLMWRVYSGHGSLSDPNFVYFGAYEYLAFWYVPFIMVMFAIAPLHIKFIECPERARVIILGVSLIFSMLLGRHNQNPFVSVLFWNSVYLFGIYCAVHWDFLKNLDSNGRICIFAVTVLYLALCASAPGYAWLGDFGTRDIKLGINKISWVLPGKMMACVCLIYVFEWVQAHGWKILKKCLSTLATYSFSIFFLHNFIWLNFDRNHHTRIFSPMNYYEIQLSAFAVTVAACILCIMVAWPIKKLTGKYSRMIIGS